ncbi:hypothetical protein J3459_018451 [Metarhizium acridum]|nr:hypothetical protein J3459_018451 [Metarhizium acridum]
MEPMDFNLDFCANCPATVRWWRTHPSPGITPMSGQAATRPNSQSVCDDDALLDSKLRAPFFSVLRTHFSYAAWPVDTAASAGQSLRTRMSGGHRGAAEDIHASSMPPPTHPCLEITNLQGKSPRRLNI